MSLRTRAAAVVASTLVHAAIFAGLGLSLPDAPRARLVEARAGAGTMLSLAGDLARPVVADARRARLISAAREARRDGTLALGSFLLAANAIDAAEEGTPFDAARAARLYEERLAALREALAHARPELAVPKVFGDLRYAGMPGGRVGDTLLSGSGSCEPLGQLVAASLHDAGLGDEVHLRYYGGLSSGVSHLTAVLRSGGVERDLVAGTRSARGGKDFPASELVEAYARAHGLAATPPPSPSPSDRPADDREGLFADTPPTRTMTAGYPSNDDVFEGALPLYAARAIAEPVAATRVEAGATAEAPDQSFAESCAVLLRFGELDPPSATAEIDGAGNAMAVTLHHVPTRSELERTATNVAELERAAASVKSAPVRRLVALGCLAGLYDRAALEFSFAREPAVATRAVLEARRVKKEGADLVRSLGLADDAGRDARKELVRDASIGAWVLLYFDRGEDAVERLVRETPDDSFVAVELATALIVNPASRVRGVALAAGLPLDTQILVMQELAHAHDNARPWSGTYDPDLATFGDSDGAKKFALTYRVLRPVAWRLWEVPAPPKDTIAALLADAKKKGLDPATTHAILAYFVQNALWLYARRDEASRLFGELDRGLVDNGLGSLLDFDDVKPYPADARVIRAALDAYALQAGRAR